MVKFFCLFCFMCVLRVDILGSFYSTRHGAQFYHYCINGLWETISYNGLRQVGFISFKWSFLFGVLSVDSKQRISFGSSSVLYLILLLSQGCCNWILFQSCTKMPSVTKPTCTHVIIISLWLICYIQCVFKISYLSILGIAAHNRCNISHVFTFLINFNVVLRLSFIWLFFGRIKFIYLFIYFFIWTCLFTHNHSIKRFNHQTLSIWYVRE